CARDWEITTGRFDVW
nr:immunoglobulin heavy chain junction region [Macaca mulatta]